MLKQHYLKLLIASIPAPLLLSCEGSLTDTSVTDSSANSGDYYIAVGAFNTDGVKSAPSNVMRVTLSDNTNVILRWTPPTQNTDGSTLTNLAGYTIYYKDENSTNMNSVDLHNPGLASYVHEIP